MWSGGILKVHENSYCASEVVITCFIMSCFVSERVLAQTALLATHRPATTLHLWVAKMVDCRYTNKHC